MNAESTLERAIVWDNHGCMPLRCDASFLPQLERYRTAGVNMVSLNVGYGPMPWEKHVAILSFMRVWIDRHSDVYRLITTAEEVQDCKKDGKLGVVFDVEGMYPVQDDLHLVKTFYDLGVRWMLIAYNRNNKAGGGCMDADTGLTATGRAVIDAMERVGMVLCLSHAGVRTAAEALDYAHKPVIFSHSNPSGCHPHARNVSDDLMRACARKGGVVGLSGIGDFIGASERLVDHLLAQVRYCVDLVGADHVGLGLDYVFDRSELEEHLRSNPQLYPPGLQSDLPMVPPEAIGEIAEGLLKDGLRETQVAAILGGNWLRIAQQIWR